MMRRFFTVLLVTAGLAVGGIYYFGGKLPALPAREPQMAVAPKPVDAAIAVTVTTVQQADFVDMIMLTGSEVKSLRLGKAQITESYASPEAAKKAYERLRKVLGGEGYKEG